MNRKIIKTATAILLFCTAFVFITYLALTCHGRFAIPYDSDVRAAMEKYYSQVHDYFNIQQPVMFILHRNGNYQQYAKNINCECFDHKNVQSVNNQMDIAFNRFDAHGVEIDLRHIENSNDNNIYICHDYIDKSFAAKPEQQMYLSKNNLKTVLDNFIQKKYYRSGRTIYFELKVPRKDLFSNNRPVNSDQRIYLEKITAIVKKRSAEIINRHDRELFRSHIAFISFNFHAIEYTASQLGHLGFDRYYYLAATNRPVVGRLALVDDRELNYLTPQLIRQLKNAPWLSGIWFDPRGIDSSIALFEQINADRKKKLAASLFVYNMNIRELVDHFKNEISISHKKLPLEAIIFEVQKNKDPDYHGSCN